MNKKRNDDFLFGIIILVIGVVLVLRAVGIYIPILFRGWWALFLIIPGVISIKNRGLKLSNGLMVAGGIILFMRSRGWIWIGFGIIWKLIIPLCLIGAGIRILANSSRR